MSVTSRLPHADEGVLVVLDAPATAPRALGERLRIMTLSQLLDDLDQMSKSSGD